MRLSQYGRRKICHVRIDGLDDGLGGAIVGDVILGGEPRETIARAVTAGRCGDGARRQAAL